MVKGNLIKSIVTNKYDSRSSINIRIEKVILPPHQNSHSGDYETLALCWGAQWPSGRVLDSRPRGREFEPHRRHCVVSLSKAHLSYFSTGSVQEDPSLHN